MSLGSILFPPLSEYEPFILIIRRFGGVCRPSFCGADFIDDDSYCECARVAEIGANVASEFPDRDSAARPLEYNEYSMASDKDPSSLKKLRLNIGRYLGTPVRAHFTLKFILFFARLAFQTHAAN